MSKLANDFLTAIGILTEDAVAKSGAVKMIKAIVSAVKVNEIDTNYKIKYQDTEFLAVGSAGYSKGDQVYVITPGDNTQTYSIHSKIQTNSNGEEIYQSETDKYDITSTNLISGSTSAVGWNNDDEGSEIVLYDYDDPNPQPIEVRQDNNELADQFNSTRTLQVQVKFIYNFEVNINLYYDLIFTFITKEGKKLEYGFSINDMPNNPYVAIDGQVVAKNFILSEETEILRLQSIKMSRNMVGIYQIQNMKIYGVVKNNLQAGYSTHIIADRNAFTEDDAIIEYDTDVDGNILEDENGNPIIKNKYWNPIVLSAYMRKDGIKILDSITDNTNVYYKWYLEDKPGEFKELTNSFNFWAQVSKASTLNANQGSASWDEDAISLIATGEDNYCIFTDFQSFEAGTYLLQTKSIAKGQLFVLKGTQENYSVLGQSSQELNPQVIFTSNGSDNIAFRVDNDTYDDSLENQVANIFSDFKLIKLDSNELNLSINDIFLAEKQVKCESFYAYDNGIFIGESNKVIKIINKVEDTIYDFAIINTSINENGKGPHWRKLIMTNNSDRALNNKLTYTWLKNGKILDFEKTAAIEVDASKIDGEDLYTCIVEFNRLYCGEDKVSLIPIPEEKNDRIYIEGAKTYLYNSNNELFGSEELRPLTVFFYDANKELVERKVIKETKDEDGNIIEQVYNFDIAWSLPADKLNEGIIVQDKNINTVIIPTERTDRASETLYFGLTKYILNSSNNIIKVTITDNTTSSKPYSSQVEIGIMRNGEPGTNGTRYMCVIKPSNLKYEDMPVDSALAFGESDTYPEFIQVISYSTFELSCELIDSANYQNISLSDYTVIWEEKKKSKDWNWTRASIIDGVYTAEEPTIIRARVEKKDTKEQYFGYLTIALRDSDSYYLDPISGYSWVLYSSSFQRQNYRTNPFVIVDKFKNEIKIYDPQPAEPPLTYTNEVTELTFTNGSSIIILPILHLINRYEYAAINGWDGESITLDEENGTVLSPMAGFGSKDADNAFTGVVLGKVQRPEEDVRHGIFGLNNGVETFSLNAERGEAIFGSEGAGQIKLTPNWIENAEGKEEYKPQALITGGKFDLNSYIPGEIDENSKGMIINLTKPEIRWGSGNFIVDENGCLTAFNGTFSGSLSSKYFNANIDGSVQIGKKDAGITVKSDGLVTIDKGVTINSDVEATGLTVKDVTNNEILFQAKTTEPDNVKIGNWQVTPNLLKSPTYEKDGFYYRCFIQSPPNGSNLEDYTNFEIQKCNDSSFDREKFNLTTPFYVRPNGQLHAEDIEATGGTIGGFKLNEYRLESTVNGDNNGVGICSTVGYGYAFWAGPYDTAQSPGETSAFRVGHDGSLRATSATITGTSTIGDWQIEDGALTLGKIRLGYGEGGSSIPSIGVKRSNGGYSFYADTAGYVKMTADGYYKENGDYSGSNVQGSLAAFYYLLTTQGGKELYIPLFSFE